MTNWRCLAGLVLPLGLIGILTVCLLHGLTGGDIPFDHGIVVDAGSSKSEVTLYKWHGDKQEGTGCVTELDSCKVTGGLSKFSNPTQASESLLPCFRNISEKIPEAKRTASPVFVVATAGLRITNISNPYLTMAILYAVQCTLKLYPLDVRYVGIMDGRSEGLLAWVTTNFLLGNLQKGEHSTVGALDLGGASAQVAFEVTQELKNDPNVVSMKLYGQDYHVYSTSYLCYGNDEAYRRYLVMFADDPDKTGTRYHPCAPKGTPDKQVAKYLFDHPCTSTAEYKKWVYLNPEKLNQNYTFEGTGDVAECKRAMSILYGEKCNLAECFRPINSSIVPKNFMAFATYFFTTMYFNSTKTEFANFTTILDNFCALDWKDAQNIKTPGAEPKFIYKYCFQGQGILHLLTVGYGFNATTWPNIEFTGKVNNTSVGWSLGYMINATNAIPAEKANPPIISWPVFIVVLLISVVLCILFVVFVIQHRRNRKTGSSVAA